MKHIIKREGDYLLSWFNYANSTKAEIEFRQHILELIFDPALTLDEIIQAVKANLHQQGEEGKKFTVSKRIHASGGPREWFSMDIRYKTIRWVISISESVTMKKQANENPQSSASH